MTDSGIRSYVEAMSLKNLRKIAIKAIDPDYDPIERVMNIPLDDRIYYGLDLAQRLTHALAEKESANQPIPNPNALPQAWLLVEQVYHLIANGQSELLTKSSRLKRYGDDYYIANLIVILQTPAHNREMFGDPTEVEIWDDLLWRIGSNANLFPSTQRLTLENRQKAIDLVRQRFDVVLICPSDTNSPAN
ncbi:hypothetical protein ACQ4M3_00670 [Leptolyngbya sp. AN03gr2]|uniref:hypothetical protein n=1 Tax=unclassified Leptolyngbya TaxID=2650499 RepID=UPI003D312711